MPNVNVDLVNHASKFFEMLVNMRAKIEPLEGGV